MATQCTEKVSPTMHAISCLAVQPCKPLNGGIHGFIHAWYFLLFINQVSTEPWKFLVYHVDQNGSNQ